VERTRVLIVDDHDAVRQALETRLRSASEVEVVGCTGCCQEGLHIATELGPDVVLLETKRSDGQGLAILRQLREECPQTRVVVLTSYADPDERRQALREGAIRYLLKDLGSTGLVREIREVTGPRAPI
jgi:DNA-binding NarL/FixJ family response regulator